MAHPEAVADWLLKNVDGRISLETRLTPYLWLSKSVGTRGSRTYGGGTYGIGDLKGLLLLVALAGVDEAFRRLLHVVLVLAKAIGLGSAAAVKINALEAGRSAIWRSYE